MGSIFRTARIFPGTTEEDFCKYRQSPGYGEGDVVTLMFVSVFDSVLLEGAGDSFTIVVLLSVFFSEGGLVTSREQGRGASQNADVFLHD